MSGTDWLRLVTLSLLWGGSFLFVGIAAPVMPPFTVSLARVGLAALVLATMLPLMGVAWPGGRAVWRALVVMGVLNNVIPFSLFALAQAQIESGLAAILNATTPLWGVLVAHLLTRDERITGARVLGVVTGFAGVAVMMGASWGEGTATAQLACLAAALSYALAGVWGRRLWRMGVAPLSAALGQVICSSLVLLPLVLLVDRPWMLAVPEPRVIAALIGLAVPSTAFAYGLYFRLIASAGAVNALLVTLLIPVSATLLGALVLGEVLAPRHAIGMALIALGLSALDGRLWRWLRRRPTGH